MFIYKLLEMLLKLNFKPYKARLCALWHKKIRNVCFGRRLQATIDLYNTQNVVCFYLASVKPACKFM